MTDQKRGVTHMTTGMRCDIVCALSFSENTEENNMGEKMDYGTGAIRIIFALKT